MTARLGLGEQGRANKVRIVPIRWFYEPAGKAVTQK
jgi:hypothetical protein